MSFNLLKYTIFGIQKNSLKGLNLVISDTTNIIFMTYMSQIKIRIVPPYLTCSTSYAILFPTKKYCEYLYIRHTDI